MTYYQPRQETLDELRAETAGLAEIRCRRIQMLMNFHRWDREWGAYPAQWEVDEVKDLMARHVAPNTPEDDPEVQKVMKGMGE